MHFVLELKVYQKLTVDDFSQKVIPSDPSFCGLIENDTASAFKVCTTLSDNTNYCKGSIHGEDKVGCTTTIASGTTATPTPTQNPSSNPTANPTSTPTQSPTPTPATTPPGTTRSPSPSPAAATSSAPCTLTKAYWTSLFTSSLTSNPVIEGTDVSLHVEASGNCNNQGVTVTIYEDNGILGSDFVRTAFITMSSQNNNSAILTWTSKYQPDCVVLGIPLCDPPEYYFTAEFPGNSSSKIRSADPELQVLKANAPAVRVFATSTTYNGDLAGVTGADAKCQASADARNLGGSWKTWISDYSTSAADRLNHYPGPYRLLDGTLIATSWGDLTDWTLASNGIDIDEFGRQLPNDQRGNWTGSYSNGAKYQQNATQDNCSNWTSSSSSLGGITGETYPNIAAHGASWGGSNADGSYVPHGNCADAKRLYCFEQSHTQIDTTTPNTAYRRVFVTSQNFGGIIGDGGLAGADARCQAAATGGAALGGSWKAWLSDSTTTAASRLGHATVPYKLINGTTIANNWTDLTDGSLVSKINIDEFGKEVPSADVWTGTAGDGLYAGSSCNNWTSRDSSVTGMIGNVSAVRSVAWTRSGPGSACSNSGKLYCFEQSSADPTPPPPLPCVNGYIDADKDGYGAGSYGCYQPSSAYNIVSNNTDCYDVNDANGANVHPGQTAYFADAYTVSGSFDYNCDGSNTPSPQTYYSLGSFDVVPSDSCQSIRSVSGYISNRYQTQPCGSAVFTTPGSECAGYNYKGCTQCLLFSTASNPTNIPSYVTCH